MLDKKLDTKNLKPNQALVSTWPGWGVVPAGTHWGWSQLGQAGVWYQLALIGTGNTAVMYLYYIE